LFLLSSIRYAGACGKDDCLQYRQPEDSSPLAIQYFSMVRFCLVLGVRSNTLRAHAGLLQNSGARPFQRAGFPAGGNGRPGRGPACFELMVQERQSGMDRDTTVSELIASSFRRVRLFRSAAAISGTGTNGFCESTAFALERVA
jgi:hypothetical protein